MDGSRSDDATNCGDETILELMATEGYGEVALSRKGHLKFTFRIERRADRAVIHSQSGR